MKEIYVPEVCATMQTQKNKNRYFDFVEVLLDPAPGAVEDAVRRHVHEDVSWHGFHPINELNGRDAVIRGFWRPLLTSFPDICRRTDILLGGNYEGQEWLSNTGHFMGTFENDWLGIPATGKLSYLHFGEFHRLENGKIVESAILIDLIDLMRQGGMWPLPEQSLGTEANTLGPMAADGLVMTPQDNDESLMSLNMVQAMITGLNTPGNEWKPYWHKNMMWYGPAGIGTLRGIPAFESFQVPFERAFDGWGGGLSSHTDTQHLARIAEGNWVASTGFPSVTGECVGKWLGFEPNGKRMYMRVMDWWRRNGEVLGENWVFIDLPKTLLDLYDYDVFDNMRSIN